MNERPHYKIWIKNEMVDGVQQCELFCRCKNAIQAFCAMKWLERRGVPHFMTD